MRHNLLKMLIYCPIPVSFVAAILASGTPRLVNNQPLCGACIGVQRQASQGRAGLFFLLELGTPSHPKTCLPAMWTALA
jgi:hypothetical protein